MKLTNLNFKTWLASPSHKSKFNEERWLRELYPWPVLAEVEFDSENIDIPQKITYDDVEHFVTLHSIRLQNRGTYRCRLEVDSEGFGWHARSWSDRFDVCYSPEGDFVTLFHVKNKEPLEKIAKAFFQGRFEDMERHDYKRLGVSRFLSACLVTDVALASFPENELEHYPTHKLEGGGPLLSDGEEVWIGNRHYSEHAYVWARNNAHRAKRVVCIYVCDSTSQIRTDLPDNCEVVDISELDDRHLAGVNRTRIELIRRKMELPVSTFSFDELTEIVKGERVPLPEQIRPIHEADVHEALSAVRPCFSTLAELQYRLSAAVLLNAWLDSVSKRNPKKKKFYAFKSDLGQLVEATAQSNLREVTVWAEYVEKSPMLYIRTPEVEFSFRSIPNAKDFLHRGNEYDWRGVRLKKVAPLLLEWARSKLDQERLLEAKNPSE